jgi:hypothetical protein
MQQITKSQLGARRFQRDDRTTSDKRRRGWWNARKGALTKVFGSRFRYGNGTLYQFTDDDAGREDLRILLDHYAYSNPQAIQRVIKARAPWLTGSERESLIEQAGRYWTSAALAEALRLTEAERIALGGVPTIGAIDVTPERRMELRKQRDTERKRQKRRAAKMQSRAQYLAANSISRTKPWLADNVSRATWYRQHRETTLSAVNLLNTADTPVSSSVSGLPAVLPLQDGNVVVGANINAIRRDATPPTASEWFRKAA